MNVIGLLAIDSLPGDSIDIAVAMTATTSSACVCTRTTSDSLKGLRMAPFSRVFGYNLTTIKEAVIPQIIENDDFLSSELSRP